QPVPRRRATFHLNHLAIVGLAAAFLLVLMTGGITSVILMAQNRQSVTLSQGAGNNVNSAQRASQVSMVSSATATTYPHVVSAAANRQYIYYTAYGASNSDWMLEQLDTTQKISTPLLPAASTSPLIIMGVSQDRLVLLQFDPPQSTKNTAKKTKGAAHSAGTSSTRSWKLYSLALSSDQSTMFTDPATPQLLQQGTFDQKTAPSWVHTPVQ